MNTTNHSHSTRLGAPILALLASLVAAGAQNIFVNIRTSGSTPSTSTVAAPAGFPYSAVAPAPGTTWNTVGRSTTVPQSTTPGTTNTIYNGLPLTSAAGTSLPQTLTVAYSSVITTGSRTEPSTASGENALQPGIGNLPTSSPWQPSRYDTVLVSNRTCVVDAVGQRAGILRLTNNAILNITNGWLNVADRIDIAAGCTVAVQYSGSLRVTKNIVNNGTLRLTGSAGLTIGGSITNDGLLDAVTWSGALPTIVNNGIVLDYSLVKVGSAGVDGTNVVVTIQGYTGHNYQLQCRDDLSGGAWTDIDFPVAGSDAPIVLTHIGGATAQKRFYRVAVST
jgi:hypothetical protein